MLESFLKNVAGLKACNFIKKTLTRSFSCEYCEIFKNSFSHRTSQVAASALRVIPDVVIFVNMEIVGKLKYTNGLQLGTSLKSDLLHRYLLFPFFAGTSILNIFI